MTKYLTQRIGSFREMPLKKQVFFLLPYILSMLVCCRAAELYRLCSGNLVMILKNVDYLYKSLPRLAVTDLLIGVPVGLFIVWYIKTDREIHKKNTRPKEEYGSSRWSA